MTQIFLVSRQRRTLLQKVWAGVMALSMMLSYGGAAVVSAFLLVPQVASAVVVPQILFADGFEGGNFSAWTSADSPKWLVDGSDAKYGTKSAKVTDDTGSDSDDLRKEISTVGYENITITFWYRIVQALGPQDHLTVEWKQSSGGSYATLGGSDIHNEEAGNWKKVTLAFPASAENKSGFRFKFAANLDDNNGNSQTQDDIILIDGVEVTGTPVDADKDGVPDTTDNCPLVSNPSQSDVDNDGKGDACDTEADLKSCTDGVDNDADQLVDSADPQCTQFYGALTVTKTVIGGDKLPGDFTLKVCPVPVAPMLNSLLGVSVAYATMVDPCTVVANGQKLQLLPGQYQVTEVEVSPYVKTYSSGNCGTDGIVNITANGVFTCEMTNTYDICPNIPNAQQTVPPEYTLEQGQCVPVQKACTDQTSTITRVSDASDVVQGPMTNAKPTFVHGSWVNIPGATWIWEKFNVMFPTQQETKTFVKTFNVSGTPTGATLQVAADNTYKVWLNGTPVCEDLSPDNYSSVDLCTVPTSLILAGANTLKMEVTNLALENGTAESNPAGALYKLEIAMNACPMASISATKIVCDNESDLPNWSGADVSITADTAADFLAAHQETCRAVPGWKFQSANQTATDPGDAYLGEALAPYVTSAPTNVSGVTTWNVSLAGVTEIRAREVLQSGYIPFTYASGNSNVSAEFWCADDVLNYDNFDFIRNPQNGTTYHCVAFNVPKPADAPVCGNAKIEEGEQCDDGNNVSNDGCSAQCMTEVDVCLNEGWQSVIPEGQMLDENGYCIEIPVCDGKKNLLANGGFEDPTLGAGTWATVLDSDPLLKWLMDYVGSVSDGDASHKGIEIQNNAAGAPLEGSQLAELDGYHPSQIWQKVTTIPGKEYVLTYQYSARPNTDAAENTMEVSANGSVLATIPPTVSGSVTNWFSMSHTFAATTTYTNFLFKDLGPDDSDNTGGLGMYVDDVQLVCRTPQHIPQCSDGIDNDDDGLVDHSGSVMSDTTVPTLDTQLYDSEMEVPNNDPGCSSPQDDDERNVCSDGLDNDGDGLLDSQDPGCSNPEDMDEYNAPGPGTFGGSDPYTYGCTDKNATNYNGSANRDDNSCQYPPVVETGGERSGTVLGAATVEPEEPAGPTCGEYISTYMRMGKKNDPEEVKKLQEFLNTVMNANIPVTGFFGPMTHNWVKKFQKQYHAEIIQPWENAGFKGADLKDGTGFVYKTTKRWINIMKCEMLKDTPIPELTPFTGNGN